jgi:hypothetical protein
MHTYICQTLAICTYIPEHVGTCDWYREFKIIKILRNIFFKYILKIGFATLEKNTVVISVSIYM